MEAGEVVTKQGAELTDDELRQMEAAILREFGVAPLGREVWRERLVFLLTDGDAIAAMGAFQPVAPVRFGERVFALLGFVEVIANIKGQGCGKRVVTAMRAYLRDHDLTGLGFCLPKVQGFYAACGLALETGSTPRFVHRTADRAITNQDGQVIFYQESSDRFMATVLADPSRAVLLPTAGLW